MLEKQHSDDSLNMVSFSCFFYKPKIRTEMGGGNGSFFIHSQRCEKQERQFCGRDGDHCVFNDDESQMPDRLRRDSGSLRAKERTK
jgi:hypothetical protein